MDSSRIINSDGWGYLCPRTSPQKKMQLDKFASRFLVPTLEKYPELWGKVYIALRKDGFYAYKEPVLNIIIPENCMVNYDEYRLRFIMAHELFHLIQFMDGITSKWNVKVIERQATFMAFGRGFSLDYIKAFPNACQRNSCDMKGRFGYFNCSWIFKKCCRNYTDKEQINLAQQLEMIASKYSLKSEIDYKEVVKSELFGL